MSALRGASVPQAVPHCGPPACSFLKSQAAAGRSGLCPGGTCEADRGSDSRMGGLGKRRGSAEMEREEDALQSLRRWCLPL